MYRVPLGATQRERPPGPTSMPLAADGGSRCPPLTSACSRPARASASSTMISRVPSPSLPGRSAYGSAVDPERAWHGFAGPVDVAPVDVGPDEADRVAEVVPSPGGDGSPWKQPPRTVKAKARPT